jgi:hypothetical protein
MFIVFLESLITELMFFSSAASFVFRLFMSARRDFGIPDVFGMLFAHSMRRKAFRMVRKHVFYRAKTAFWSLVGEKIPQAGNGH